MKNVKIGIAAIVFLFGIALMVSGCGGGAPGGGQAVAPDGAEQAASQPARPAAARISPSDVGPVYSADAEADAVNISCGDVITTDTVLANDVVCTDYIDAITFGASGITLDCNGHSISGGGVGRFGAYARDKTDLAIKNCNISGFVRGIQLLTSTMDVLNNNLFENTGNAIFAWGDDIQISANSITDNGNDTGRRDGGIYAYSGARFTITGNYFSANSTAVYNDSGHVFIWSVSDSLIDGNTFENTTAMGIAAPSIINTTISNNTIDGTEDCFYLSASIALPGGTDNKLINNTIDGSCRGIFIINGSQRFVVSGNTITNSGVAAIIVCNTVDSDIEISSNLLDTASRGVSLCGHYPTEDVTIKQNTIRNMIVGIESLDSANFILDNDIQTFTSAGITVRTNTIASGNTIDGSGDTGIFVGEYGNTVSGNTITGPVEGIDTQSGSYSNTLSGNTVLAQKWGIKVYSGENYVVENNDSRGADYGIWIYNSSLALKGNTALQNNIYDVYCVGTNDIDNQGGNVYETTNCECLACADADEDGYGVCPNCGTASGCAYDGEDCDDSDASINPGAEEICDGLDNNCDGQADEPVCGEGTDADCDGVSDCGEDLCPGTEDWFASMGLKPDHYDSSNIDYSLTYGCGCDQILACKPGKNAGEYKAGCAPGTYDVWTAGTDWAAACQ